MQIFNIVEELEKERKKNKELKKEIEKLTTESTEWEERTYCWQDRAEDLQIIIDKVIEYIKEDMYGEPNELYGLVDGEHILELLEEIE